MLSSNGYSRDKATSYWSFPTWSGIKWQGPNKRSHTCSCCWGVIVDYLASSSNHKSYHHQCTQIIFQARLLSDWGLGQFYLQRRKQAKSSRAIIYLMNKFPVINIVRLFLYCFEPNNNPAQTWSSVWGCRKVHPSNRHVVSCACQESTCL